MALMFSTAELADLQATVLTTLRDVATVTRGGSPIVAGVPCTVAADTLETRMPWMGEQERLRRFILVFPVGTAAMPGDRVSVTGDGVYGVSEVGVPQTYALSAEAFGYRLYAPDGTTPVYFTPNAHITLSRYVEGQSSKQSTLTQVATNVPACINDIGVQVQLTGNTPGFDLLLVVDGSVDIRDGDRVTGYSTGTTQRAQVMQVQHVDHNQMAGWDYKLASVTVKE